MKFQSAVSICQFLFPGMLLYYITLRNRFKTMPRVTAISHWPRTLSLARSRIFVCIRASSSFQNAATCHGYFSQTQTQGSLARSLSRTCQCLHSCFNLRFSSKSCHLSRLSFIRVSTASLFPSSCCRQRSQARSFFATNRCRLLLFHIPISTSSSSLFRVVLCR